MPASLVANVFWLSSRRRHLRARYRPGHQVGPPATFFTDRDGALPDRKYRSTSGRDIDAVREIGVKVRERGGQQRKSVPEEPDLSEGTERDFTG